MIFRQSAVTALTRETVVEEADRLPVDIHPALVGTGRLGLALDATGMQGVNTWLGHYPDCYSLEHTSWLTEKHLHIYRDRALSQHYAPEPERDLGFNNPATLGYSLLPLGWIEYTVEIDGQACDLVRDARRWRREFTPREGLLTTAFELGPLRLTWSTAPILDQPVTPFALEVRSTDGAEHRIRVTVKLKLELRDGRPLATGGLTWGEFANGAWLRWEARDDTSAAGIYEPVTVRWTLFEGSGSPQARPPVAGTGDVDGGRACGEPGLALTWSATTPATTHFVFVCGADYDGTESPGFAAKWAAVGIETGRQSWRDWFAEGMDVWVGDPEREYLQACAQYTLRAGAPWDHGCPLGTIWTQKFGAMTFWDTFFAVDGLLRAGHVDEARRFADWCTRTMQPAGRPHYWMSWYDGTPGSNPANDQGYQSALAFAQSLIRYAEVTGDTAAALPYLRRLAEYLLDAVLAEDAAGTWTMKGTVAHDVGVETFAANSQPVILAWAVSCLAKYAEYATEDDAPDSVAKLDIARHRESAPGPARSAGPTGHTVGPPLRGGPFAKDSDDALTRRARAAATFFRQAATKIDLTTGVWNDWAPNLTQSQPFADYRGWAAWFAKRVATVPLLGRQIMAWGGVNHAVSCAVAGEPSVGLQSLDQSHDHVSGLGYLGESLWEFKCGGNTPYVPSSGGYLAAVAALICTGTIWPEADGAREVWIGPNLPERWRNNRFRWQNVVALNGVRTSGRYEPTRLEVELSARQPVRLRLAVPPRIEGSVLAVTVDGRAVPVAPESSTEGPPRSGGPTGRLVGPALRAGPGNQVLLDLPAGAHTVSLARDESARPEILLIEPSLHGRALQAILAKTGRATMRLCETSNLPDWVARAPVIVLPQQYVTLRVDHAEALARAVERGARLVCLHHSASRLLDRRLAALLGLNGTHTRDYQYTASRVELALTAAGRRALPGVPERFPTWITTPITPAPESDVEVLATHADGCTAAVTRRRVGKGWTAWACMGDKLMDRKNPGEPAPEPGLSFCYTDGGGAPFLTFGKYPDELCVPRWMHEPSFEPLLLALAGANW